MRDANLNAHDAAADSSLVQGEGQQSPEEAAAHQELLVCRQVLLLYLPSRTAR